ncbi:MAG: 4Fe-4S dicluster domain-containing protein [Thermodesulfobacteriota bacterium]
MQEAIYRKLAEKLDMFVTGAPKKGKDFSPAFLQYLEILFTPEEAELAAFLSVAPQQMTAEEVAEKAGRPADEVQQVLDQLADKGGVLGIGGQYMLPIIPIVVNHHPFRDKDDEDTLKAGHLYEEYYIKDGFYRFYEASAAGTPYRRTVPVDQSIASGQQVLSHEEIDAYLDQANMGVYALAPCPCRNRKEKLGTRECKDKFPVASCLFVGMFGLMMLSRGDAKQVSREEAKKYLDEMRELGLVTMTDNAKEMKDGVICVCCGCCCSITRGLTRWDNPKALARSNFVASVNDDCSACGTCVDRCMFDALSLGDGDDQVQIDQDRCVGCGVCTVTCPTEALRLERIEREPIFSDSPEMYAKVSAENEAAGQKRPSE